MKVSRRVLDKGGMRWGEAAKSEQDPMVGFGQRYVCPSDGWSLDEAKQTKTGAPVRKRGRGEARRAAWE